MDNKDGMWLVRYVYEMSNVTTLVTASNAEEARDRADFQVQSDLFIYPEEAKEVTVTLEGTFAY